MQNVGLVKWNESDFCTRLQLCGYTFINIWILKNHFILLLRERRFYKGLNKEKKTNTESLMIPTRSTDDNFFFWYNTKYCNSIDIIFRNNISTSSSSSKAIIKKNDLVYLYIQVFA